MQSARIRSRNGEHERVVAWSAMLKGAMLEWTEREWADPARHRIDFEQVDGDLDAYSGFWQLERAADGGTLARLSVDFEIGIPLLADMLNPVACRALRDDSQQMLREIERRVAADRLS